MLRITARNSRGRATLQLEGRVIGPWVDEPRRSCQDVFGAADHLTLDLTAVTFIDAAGIRLFETLLRDRAVTVVNCSPFVTEQLRGVSLC